MGEVGQGVRTGLGHGGLTYFCCCKIDTRWTNSHGETGRVMRSVKLWLYLFLTD